MILNIKRSRILMCKDPTDMRLGYDGLHKLAKKVFRQNPYHGQSFVFINRRRTTCKVYMYDGSGDVVVCKRLSQGVFCRPNPSYKRQIRMTGSEFNQFFEGLNISGRILESTPESKPSRERLRFIPPYRRLNSYAGVNTRTNQTHERTQ